jgi:hypothetical protein
MLGKLRCSSNEPNREPRAIRGRARRCNRERTPLDVTGRFGREDAVVERSGSQKTCLGKQDRMRRGRRRRAIRMGIKTDIPDRCFFGPGFFMGGMHVSVLAHTAGFELPGRSHPLLRSAFCPLQPAMAAAQCRGHCPGRRIPFIRMAPAELELMMSELM